jgi:hypothetical protein
VSDNAFRFPPMDPLRRGDHSKPIVSPETATSIRGALEDGLSQLGVAPLVSPSTMQASVGTATPLVPSVPATTYVPPPSGAKPSVEPNAQIPGWSTAATAAVQKQDVVNSPSHYNAHPSGVECITITEGFDFVTGNVIKYVWRAGLKKDRLEDLQKAEWYLKRAIATEQKRRKVIDG